MNKKQEKILKDIESQLSLMNISLGFIATYIARKDQEGLDQYIDSLEDTVNFIENLRKNENKKSKNMGRSIK